MFGTASRVLVRWARGLISVGEAGEEAYLEVSGLQDYEEAKRLGEALLEAYKGQRGTFSVTGHVHTAAQQPGGSWYVADTMGGLVIQSIAIGMDAEGQTVVTPELGDPLQRRLDALSRRVAKAPGTASEFSSPFPDRAKQSDEKWQNPPIFTYDWPKTSGGSS